MEAEANSAVMPITINVTGRLVITDDQDRPSADPNKFDQTIRVKKSKGGGIATGATSIRIRSNLKKWQLSVSKASENDFSGDEKKLFLTYETNAGSNANPDAGVLTKPFRETITLNDIRHDAPEAVLVGTSKTSLKPDSENVDNWFGLKIEYSYAFSNNNDVGKIKKKTEKDINTSLSYSLVSL